MSMFGSYHIVKAESSEARARHLAFTAHLVWSPLLLADLERDAGEITGHVPQAPPEKKKKKKSSGEGEDSGDGSTSGDGHAAKKAAPKEDEPGLLEAHALLLYKTEHGAHLPIPADMKAPLAAATLLLDRAEKSAQLRTTLRTDDAARQAAATEYLPSFERHAAQVGAHIMYVRVHPSAIGMFRRELGYEAVGSVVIENGLQIQAMRKIIGFHAPLPGETPA